MRFLFFAFAALSLSACQNIKTADQLTPQVVSSSTYKTMSCEELLERKEASDIKLSQAKRDLNNSYDEKKTQELIVLLVFWPANPFLDGNKRQQREYEAEAGENRALEQSLNSKNC